ncbi:MAG: alanine racemase [Chromatiaceae bacterium]|nr:alanine racemase [Chromatiaceae bacterium]
MQISFAEIEYLEGWVGNAFYLLDLDQLTHNYRQLAEVFQSTYPESRIAYSYKTNYAPSICRHLRALGAMAEVVSEMEYEMAQRVGHSGAEIVVNGPLHSQEFLARALLAGAIVNLDSWYMLEHLGAICRAHSDHRFRVGLRLNYGIGEDQPSRFGFEADDQVMARVRNILAEYPNCSLRGLHSHFSRSSRTLESFARRVRGLLDASRRYFGDMDLEYYNLGGGFLGELPDGLARQYEIHVPSNREYADTVAGAFADAFSGTSRPTLFIEPGTAVVGNAMSFVCRVIDLKTIGGTRLALVNASRHNVETVTDKDPPVRVVRRSEPDSGGNPADYDIVGYTCVEADRLVSALPGPLDVGDHLVFDFMGAYTNVRKRPFIRPSPPIVARQGGRYTIAKRQETVDDILCTYS